MSNGVICLVSEELLQTKRPSSSLWDPVEGVCACVCVPVCACVCVVEGIHDCPWILWRDIEF